MEGNKPILINVVHINGELQDEFAFYLKKLSWGFGLGSKQHKRWIFAGFIHTFFYGSRHYLHCLAIDKCQN